MTKNIPNHLVEILIRSAPKELFDEEIIQSLRVSIRIVDDFCSFLSNSDGNEYPTDVEADYIIGTIRSGFDFYFDLYYISKYADNSVCEKIDRTVILNFRDFKKYYIEKVSSISTDLEKSVLVILELWRMHFIFIGMAS
jgi:hypothetical protein